MKLQNIGFNSRHEGWGSFKAMKRQVLLISDLWNLGEWMSDNAENIEKLKTLSYDIDGQYRIDAHEMFTKIYNSQRMLLQVEEEFKIMEERHAD